MKVIITGGCGFIGSNVAARFLNKGDTVIIFDNLSRCGSVDNLKWLESLDGKFTFIEGDIRDFSLLASTFSLHNNVDFVLHMVAQVAVTKSVRNPREDFEINSLGTFNLLEAIRTKGITPYLLYASTNKVYGNLSHLNIVEKKTRYDSLSRPDGIDESEPIDFYSPYGCSKGSAEQYVRDYSRIYGIPATVLRQSCIYGPRQMGVEDQGWIAWFIIAALLNRSLVIYGDGKQVRDLLYIDDLIDCYELCYRYAGRCSGEIYNVGGGREASLSVWVELKSLLENYLHQNLQVSYSEWRPGDQKWYISEIQKISNITGWKPKIFPKEGIPLLIRWMEQHRTMLEGLFLETTLKSSTINSLSTSQVHG